MFKNRSFKKKLIFSILTIMVLFVTILYIALIPSKIPFSITRKIEDNTENIINNLSNILTNNSIATLTSIEQSYETTIGHSIQKSQDDLRVQTIQITSNLQDAIEKTYMEIVEHQRNMIIDSEERRIRDLTTQVTTQFHRYLIELDYLNLHVAINQLMNDEDIRYAILYQTPDNVLFENFSFEKTDMIAQDTFIRSVNEDKEYKTQELLVHGEQLIEVAKPIISGTRTLGILCLGYSVQRILDLIYSNSEKMRHSTDAMFESIKNQTFEQSEIKAQELERELHNIADGQKKLLEDNILMLNDALIRNVKENQHEQATELTTTTQQTIFILGIFFISGSVIFAIPLARKISQPIKDFVSHTKIISAGELNKRIELKTGDEFDVLAEAFNNMCLEINSSRQKLADWNKLLEVKVVERTYAIKNLLNNAGQGFLTFGNSLKIDSEYSYECVNIFNKKIDNFILSDLLYETESEEKDLMNKIFNKLLKEKNVKEDLYIDLLPKEIKIFNKFIQLNYKCLELKGTDEEKKIMVILTDVTSQKNLENKMETERKVLKMVVQVVLSYNDFSEALFYYKDYCNSKINSIIDSDLPYDEILFELYRQIHTFKGTFAQFELINIVHNLHNLENKISNFIKTESNFSKSDIKNLFNPEEMIHWLEEDTNNLYEIMGKDFFKEDKVLRVDKHKIINLENKLLSLLTVNECKKIIPDIRKLRFISFSEVLEQYEKVTERLSEQTGKSMNRLIINEENDILIDPEIYNNFVKSLIHIFRNILDHGIEDLEERILSNKTERGSIIINIKKTEDNKFIDFVIKDDGKGIDKDIIKRKLLDKNIVSQEKLNEMSDSEVLNSIFSNGFTTKEQVSEVSGRGVGLNAVYKTVKELGGSCNVTSELGVGTEFSFKLPYEDIFSIPTFDVLDIMVPLLDTAQDYLLQQYEISSDLSGIDVISNQKICLKKIAATINIKGIFQGTVILSVDEKFAKCLLNKMVFDELTPEEEEELLDEAIGESLNVIIGNSIRKFPGLEEMVIIEPPVSMMSENINILYKDYSIWSCRLKPSWTENDKKEQGVILFNIVVREKNQ